MMRASPSQARIFWLLTRLRLVRLSNLAAPALRFSVFKKKKKAGRQGEAGKSGTSPLVGAVVGLFMLFAITQMAQGMLLNLHMQLDGAARFRMEPGAFSPSLLAGMAMVLTLVLCLNVFTDVGSRELAKPDWDMEWLVTLPVGINTLLWGRIAERSASSVFGVLVFAPLCGMIAWYSGYGWWAVLAAAVGMLPMLLLSALGRTMVDIGLRLSLPPPQLRNLQALMSLLGVAGMYLAFSMSSPNSAGWGVALARGFPEWATWLPPGVLVRALNAQDAATTLGLLALLAAQVALVLVAGVAWLRYQLRNGLVSTGARESTRRKSQAAPLAKSSGWLLKSPVQRRELRLLSRDRNFMVQTLLLPIVIIGGQFVMNGGT